jgi:sulfite reductase (NADPH) flavoprotein alpha-component
MPSPLPSASAIRVEAPIIGRERLTHPSSEKEVWHVVLKAPQIRYKVGDCIAVYAENDPLLVEQTMQALRLSSPHLREQLTRHKSITQINRKLEALFGPSDGHQLWDLGLTYSTKKVTEEELLAALPPLLPRFYSIASAQEVVGDEIHLTVAVTKWQSAGQERLGVSSHFLCHLGQSAQIYHHPTQDFTLPQNPHLPIIMIGPGTGIAPFRAFMQKRDREAHPGKSWLFFGEQRKAFDFLYEPFWNQLEQKGLRLSLAFSRDQEHKVYVQHRLEEEKDHLREWLQEGAVLYVCGDAQEMARDVDTTLKSIMGRDFIKEMRASGRYLRDIY